MFALALIGSVGAAEVVWVTVPTADQQALVAERAGAAGPPLSPVDLRAAATCWSDADAEALRALSAALDDARAQEDELDGELTILHTLAAPIARIGVLRDEVDRAQLFAALTYQGFAARRYFADTLGTTPEAAPYRVTGTAGTVERAWLDAFALEPDREATAYEIAEGPQRLGYNQLRVALADDPPGALVTQGFPADATLIVDGRSTDPDPSGRVAVRTGRHLVHAEVDGRIIGRWEIQVAPNVDAPLDLLPSEDDWQRFLAAPDGAVPPSIGALVRAIGGEVWIARSGPDGVRVVAVSNEGPTRVVPIEDPRPFRKIRGGFGLLGGWLWSGDFYSQDPQQVPHTRASVNTMALGGWVGLDTDVGPAQIGIGLDALATPGPHHVANTGDAALRIRPIPHVAVGLSQVQLTAGFLFPYHPATGIRLRIPLDLAFGSFPIEVRGAAWVGWPIQLSRTDGSIWSGHPVVALGTGLGAGF